MSDLTIYRSNAIEQANTNKSPKSYGLAIAPLPHQCNPPGSWLRLWYRIAGCRITHCSLWRCECKRIWKFHLLDGKWEQQGNDKTGWYEKTLIEWYLMGMDLLQDDKDVLKEYADRNRKDAWHFSDHEYNTLTDLIKTL